ncbi:MAG: hypothetical protein DWQ07_14805 [Chloroflexi bacterium]|nr:MAG: hypothetical protein DWQ07_14805 [Chloroflexota bacterium]MBL1195647.1 hypothetical protein [Chloroflexota bacterium]NOH12935.1 hypothetical protein [Chloroflexota bacterium]
MVHDAEELILKTRQYEFVDGLRDIQLGISFFVMGIFWYALALNPRIWIFILQLEVDKWIRTIAFSLILGLPVLVILATLPLMKWVRKRWLWKQTGMVNASRMVVPSRYTLFAVLVFVATVAIGIWLIPVLQTGEFYMWNVILLATGWSFALTLVGMSNYVKIRRYMFIGILGGLVSPAILLFQSSMQAAGLIFLSGWGLLLLGSGIAVVSQAWPHSKEHSHVG